MNGVRIIKPARCASRDDVHNAVKVEQQIAAASFEETELIKSIIADPARLKRMLALLEERDHLTNSRNRRVFV